MRLVLAGASGFIGEHLLKRLGDEIEVYALSRSRPANLGQSGSWIECDFNAGVDVDDLPDAADMVIHVAASYQHREFPQSAADLFAVNTSSVVALADYARQAACRRFVYMSTGSVYGTGGRESQREDSPVAPDVFWTATKRAGEMLIEQYANEFDVWIPRLFFPYGADQANRLIPNLIESVKGQNVVTMHGHRDGMMLGPIHVDDVAEILATAIGSDWTGITNISGPDVLSLRAIVTEIGRQVGTDPVVEVIEGGAPPCFDPDLSSLDALFGLDRLKSFTTGLTETLNYI